MITKVKSVQGNGTFQSQHGLLYKFEYLFEDEVSLIANHKTQISPFKPGDEVEYIITKENEYGKQGRVIKPQEQNTNKTSYVKENSENQMTKEDWRKKDIAIIYQNAFSQANSFHAITGFNDSEAQLTQLCSTADAVAKFVILKSGI